MDIAGMWFFRKVRWYWWLAGVVAAAIFIIDLAGAVRPSILSAAACTTELFRQRPDAQSVLAQNRDTIIHQARIRDLPATLLAAILVDHQRPQTRSKDVTDCMGSALGANLSLGLMQMRMGTAAQLDGNSLMELPARDFRTLRKDLRESETNITYAARELRSLLDRSIRSPGINAPQLLNDPKTMAILVSEFRAGRTPAARAKARLAIRAFSTLDLMHNGTLTGFEFEDEDSERVKAGILEYLRHINCDSGIFNESACTSWLRRHPDETSPKN
jgi:hypothetical protein